MTCIVCFLYVTQDFETKKAAGAATLGPFDQRPYFRILLNMLVDMNKPDRQLDNSNLQARGYWCKNIFYFVFALNTEPLRPQRGRLSLYVVRVLWITRLWCMWVVCTSFLR